MLKFFIFIFFKSLLGVVDVDVEEDSLHPLTKGINYWSLKVQKK